MAFLYNRRVSFSREFIYISTVFYPFSILEMMEQESHVDKCNGY